jgi:iron complex transport system ATP-binding protein
VGVDARGAFVSAFLATKELVSGFDARGLHQPLDFEIQAGECVVLLGANGAGKSTLLRTLLGLQAPIAGRVEIENINILEISAAKKAALLAYVPQRPIIPEGLTVNALLRLGAYRNENLTETIPHILQKIGAATWGERLVSELSGGEQQRVMIARALVQGAKALVLDEPTAHLDLAQSQEICTILRVICAAGTSIILSSHDPNDALRLPAKTLAFLPNGMIEKTPTGALGVADLQRIYGVSFSEISSNGQTRFFPQERIT